MKKNIFSEYFLNLATALAVAGFSFVLYKWVLTYYRVADFDFFVVVRRYQAAMLPILLLGFGVVLPKLLAMDLIKRKNLNFSISFILLFYFCCLLVSAFLPKVYYYTIIFCGPVLFSSIVFSIYRGKGDYISGCAFNVVYLIFLPVVGFFFFNGIEYFLHYYLFSACVVFLFWMIFFYKNILESSVEKFSNKEILKNSISRVPGDFLSQALYVIPVYIATNHDSSYVVAYLSFSLSVLLAFSIPLRPISTILLVRIAKANDGFSSFCRKLIFYVAFSLAMTVVYLFSIPWINKIYFNDDDFEKILFSLGFVVFFNAMYVLLRSYVDAKFHAPLLSYFNGVGVGLLFLLSYFNVDLIISLSLSIGGVIFLIIGSLVLNRKIWMK